MSRIVNLTFNLLFWRIQWTLQFKRTLRKKKYDALDNANFTEEDKVWTKEELGLNPEKEIAKYKARAELCDNVLLLEVA